MKKFVLLQGLFILSLSLLVSVFAFGQEQELIVPGATSADDLLNVVIAGDTTATGERVALNRVYVLERGGIYFINTSVRNDVWTLHIKAQDGTGVRPVIYSIVNPVTGTDPGDLFRIKGNIKLDNVIIVGFLEADPAAVSTIGNSTVRTDAAGFDIVIDGCLLTQSRGQFVRTESAARIVKITNSVLANMGDLGRSNFGAGKGVDFRNTSCDSAIFINNTFVNFQDRIIRHRTSTASLKNLIFDHNTLVNGMSYHGTLALGWVGAKVQITNNLFLDTFVAGQDTDAVRQSEFDECAELDEFGFSKMTWISSVPNDSTAWAVTNNYHSVSPAVQAFYDEVMATTTAFKGEGSPLTDHIIAKAGVEAFVKEAIEVTNRPEPMIAMAKWYRSPTGGNKTKVTTNFNRATDDYDRRNWQYFDETFDCTYPTDLAAYTGAQMGYPAGDLNWYPEQKTQWEQGATQLSIVVDGTKDSFYEALTGPDDGYLQIKSYAFNDNGIPTGDADLSANVWTAWDSKWLYLYEEVMDDTLAGNATNVWEEDEIELKFDPLATDSTQTSTFELRLTALGRATPGVVAADSLSNLPDSLKKWARTTIPGGYALELAIKWSAIKSGTETITPAVGTVFGMAINQHDNDGKARRQASVQWAAVLKDAAWNTPKYLGTVKFLEDGKLQFIPTNNVTGATNTIPYDGTPFYMRIDGKKDPFYSSLAGPDNGYVQIRSYAYNDNGKPVDDADLSAKVWTAWDDDYFYLYEEVKDDTLAGNATNSYQEDCIELKFDPQATDSVTNSIWEGRLTALGLVTGVVAADSLNNVPDSMKQWARTKVTGGYTLEMAIKWPVIKSGTETITPAVGTVFGMAICQHDNDGKARRQASVEWAAVLKDAVWNTPKYLGTVKFADDHQLQLIPTNNMTGATTIIPYDGSPFTGVEELTQIQLPVEFSLEQNYPNPFNPTTTISYSIPSASHVRLMVYDIQGREVGILVNGLKSPGFYHVTFDGKQLSSGIYFCVLETDSRIMKQKMLMIK